MNKIASVFPLNSCCILHDFFYQLSKKPQSPIWLNTMWLFENSAFYCQLAWYSHEN